MPHKCICNDTYIIKKKQEYLKIPWEIQPDVMVAYGMDGCVGVNVYGQQAS